MTIDRILVAVSFSERSIEALRAAARLAADLHSSITLLHVVEPVKRRSVGRLPAQQTLLAARGTDAKKQLARCAGEIAASARLPVDFSVEIGEKVSCIARACEEVDILFMGGINSHGSTAPRTSTAERLMGKCRVPILVISGAEGRYARAPVPVYTGYQSAAAVSAATQLWPEQLTFLQNG
jgi:nucleotide-binding universal stress UspA family protein